MSVVQSQSDPALSGILGGGPFYQKRETSIPEVKASGFTMVEIWTIQMVNAAGDLSFNAEFPLISGGQYIGDENYPNFRGDVASLTLAPSSITKVNFGLSAAGSGTFEYIRQLVASQGTGPDSILYKNFKALRINFPMVDAIDFDDETTYDAPSATQFAIMLANIGFKVAFCPYTQKGFWTAVINGLSSVRPGSIDAVYLQTYAGGTGNTPDEWAFPGIPTYPGRDYAEGPSGIASTFRSWKNQYGTSGGWVWLYDQIQGQAGTYAAPINTVFGIATRL
jgi:hypothetical protein